ncbi:MAG: class I SAM-dependent methyltransferase [Lachnospiraceae bacterium]|nr:class I SAM-dependent methyltransferase [Lachnospiraceae bacterium]
MILSDGWKEYEVLDASAGEKLERWGEYVLVRPDPQVIWDTPKKHPGWNKPNAHYHRSSKGGGEWEFFSLPEEWSISYGKLVFRLKPFSFKHTGLFPEQAANWDWCARQIRGASRQIRVLNLFAYTGAATMACAEAGAKVTHVDASKGMVQWAKENAKAAGIPTERFRYLVDDCVKFVEREIRRGSRYEAVIMDPPSYGRGPKGETWKMEEQVFRLLQLAEQVLSGEPLFLLINSYTTGLQPAVLSYMAHTVFGRRKIAEIQADEVGLRVSSTGLALPCGACCRVLFEGS